MTFSENCQRWMFSFDQLQYQHQAAYFSFRVLKFQIRRDTFHYFQRSFDWGFQWTMRYQLNCSVILWIHGWGCCWGRWKFCSNLAFRDSLLGTVGLADLGMDQMVLFFFCEFSEGWVCWKGLKPLLCGDIGLVVLSGLGSRRTHPAVRRAPRWRGGCHFHQAVYLPTLNSQWSYLSVCHWQAPVPLRPCHWQQPLESESIWEFPDLQ